MLGLTVGHGRPAAETIEAEREDSAVVALLVVRREDSMHHVALCQVVREVMSSATLRGVPGLYCTTGVKGGARVCVYTVQPWTETRVKHTARRGAASPPMCNASP